MATYNPRAGMPPRKTYKEGAPNTLRFGASPVAALDEAIADIYKMANEALKQDGVNVANPIDANALRGWLLGYMDSIGDQLPDLAQWRRIREEVGRSVAVKEAVKDTSVPVKRLLDMAKVPDIDGPIISTSKRYEQFKLNRATRAEGVATVESPPEGFEFKMLTDTLTDEELKQLVLVTTNLCGND